MDFSVMPIRNKFGVRKRRDMRTSRSNNERSQSYLWRLMTSFQEVGLPFERFRSLSLFQIQRPGRLGCCDPIDRNPGTYTDRKIRSVVDVSAR